jgi:hypothetical protein
MKETCLTSSPGKTGKHRIRGKAVGTWRILNGFLEEKRKR